MRIALSRPPLAPVAALVASIAPVAHAQCVGDVVDPLYTPTHGSDGRAVDGDRIVLGSIDAFPGRPVLEVFEAHPVTGEFLHAETIAPPEWQISTYVRHIGLEGDLMAFQLFKGFGGPHEVDILEREAQGWTRAAVALPELAWIRLGSFTDVSDGRVYTLTATSTGRPVSLHEIVKGPAGDWSIAQSLRLADAEAQWFEAPTKLEVEGDIAVITGVEGPAWQAAVVCERDGSGRWRQTDLIGPPPGFPWLFSARLDGNRLTLLHRSEDFSTGDGLVRVFERATPGGGWTLLEQLDLAATFGTDMISLGSVDGRRMSFRTHAGTAVFERTSALGFQRSWEVRDAAPVDLDGDRLAVLGWTRQLSLVDAPAHAGPTIGVDLCRLAGRTTCEGSGGTRLRVHDARFFPETRRTIAEVTGAPAGAPVVLLRSTDPASSSTSFGALCIDRRNAIPVGPPRQVTASGTATFPIDAPWSSSSVGFAAADHLQAFVLGAAPELSNAIAWLP